MENYTKVRELDGHEIELVAGGLSAVPVENKPDRRDRDGDGDYDAFDREITQAEEFGHPMTQDELDNAWAANVAHELAEDFAELLDSNPNNDSFFDGGNGSGNETPDSG